MGILEAVAIVTSSRRQTNGIDAAFPSNGVSDSVPLRATRSMRSRRVGEPEIYTGTGVSPGDTPQPNYWSTGRGTCASISSACRFAQTKVQMSAEDGPITQAWLKSDHWGERLWTDQSVKQRLKEAYAEEKRTAKPPKSIDDIPFCYEDVNTAWLEAVIAKDAPGAKLESFQLGPADSGTSDRRHIILNWNSVGQKAGLPASCFCKATQGLLNRLHLSFGAVQSEVNFYRSVRQLVKFEAPVAFHSQMNLDT